MMTMEFNKEEACRAKKIAEEKMAKNDFEGARKVALQAKQLYPELDNISQLITVCDIHCSAQKKIYGAKMDLYAILQVEKLADETTIKKQYRKLALVLHPDKNRFSGAESAFKLISEANMILSDKEKRSVYDINCKEPVKTSVTKIPKRQKNQTSNAGQNKSKTVPKAKSNGVNRAQKSTWGSNIRSTFWTCCPFCKMKYECFREFVNVSLRCLHCSNDFIGSEIGAQRGAAGPGFVNEKMQGENDGSKPIFQQKVKVNIRRNDQFSSNFACKKTEDTKINQGGTKLKVNVQKPMEKVIINDMNKKRERKTGVESHESSYDEKHKENQTSNADHKQFKNVLKAKFNGLNGGPQSTSNSNIRSTFWTSCPFCKMQYEYYREFVSRSLRCQHCSKFYIAYEIGARVGVVGPGFVNEKTQSVNLGSKPVFQQKVKVDIQRNDQFSSKFEHVKQEGVKKSKVNVQKPMETVTVNHMNKKRGRKTEVESHENISDENEVAIDVGGNTVDPKRSSSKKQHVREDGDDEFNSPKRSKPVKVSDDVEDMKKENVPRCEDTADVSTPTDTRRVDIDSDLELVECPDQEFINFDKNKEEHCFAVDQIWACYDTVDGMPRFYLEIEKIYSPEFKLRVTWLEPEPEDDLEIKWVEVGLPVGCGKFTRGETVETRDRLMFSHQMVCKKKSGSEFSYVSPQKGEIWAVFKDWDIKWSLEPKSPKKFKFDIMEILSVHDDCVSVVMLSKVNDFSSVFQRTIEEHVIPSNQRFRFSHRVPSAKLSGTEKTGVPVGSFELDLASLPVDFENDPYYHPNDVNLTSQFHEQKVNPSTSFPNTPEKDMNGLDHKSEVGSEKVNDGQTTSSTFGMQIIHDFRSDKQICKFQVGQIWAFWECGNIIRQRYVEIKQIERDTSKLHVSLLKLCNNSNKSCSRFELYDACGLFKVSAGKPKILAADLFSHIVKAEPYGKKMFNIYPKEHQIWCLCKQHENGGCEIVKVVEIDEVGIKVMFLTRVSGFKSVFKALGTQSLTEKIPVIPWIELYRFSHQIPAYYFTDGFLKDCWELDPTALTGLHVLESNQG